VLKKNCKTLNIFSYFHAELHFHFIFLFVTIVSAPRRGRQKPHLCTASARVSQMDAVWNMAGITSFMMFQA